MRGPDQNTALNLGVMKLEYMDNTANRRWVLQFDDPKVLEQINAVFSQAVEPKGESRVPKGKPTLVTYLREAPRSILDRALPIRIRSSVLIFQNLLHVATLYQQCSVVLLLKISSPRRLCKPPAPE